MVSMCIVGPDQVDSLEVNPLGIRRPGHFFQVSGVAPPADCPGGHLQQPGCLCLVVPCGRIDGRLRACHDYDSLVTVTVLDSLSEDVLYFLFHSRP